MVPGRLCALEIFGWGEAGESQSLRAKKVLCRQFVLPRANDEAKFAVGFFLARFGEMQTSVIDDGRWLHGNLLAGVSQAAS